MKFFDIFWEWFVFVGILADRDNTVELDFVPSDILVISARMELVVTTFNLSDEDLEEEPLLQANRPNKSATKRARTEAIFSCVSPLMR